LCAKPIPGGAHRGWRTFLYFAAVDAVAAGGWLAARPGDLLALLHLAPHSDALLLGHVLGVLWLGHALALIRAAARPADHGGLVLLPLLGRLLALGLWLWLLGTERVQVPRLPLFALIAHDAVWLPGFVAVLRRARQGDGSAG
jgi:hypothetical protein